MSFLRDIERFSSGKLRSVQTKVTTAEGRKFVEQKGDDGSVVAVDTGERCVGFCEDYKPDDKVYKIQEGFFISSQDGAQNLEELKGQKITHILNVGSGIENAFPQEFTYMDVELLDLPDTQICIHFPKMFEFIKLGIENGAVLVHCNAGVSRSATVVLGFLMFTYSLSLEDALIVVKKARPCVKPNEGFLQQLRDNEKQLGT